jgi:hypothetical protein
MRNVIITLIILVLASACTKEKVVMESIQNNLPVYLPAMSGVHPSKQTKDISLYGIITDLTFTATGTTRFTSRRKKLWIDIINPEVEIFGEVQIDSLFRDTVYFNLAKRLGINNYDPGINFYALDTVVMATGLDSTATNFAGLPTISERKIYVHKQDKEIFNGNNIPKDVEQGTMKGVNKVIIGFKNIKTNEVFVMEIEGDYTLKSLKQIE